MIEFLKGVSELKLSVYIFIIVCLLITFCLMYKTAIPVILVLGFALSYSTACLIKVIVGDENGNKD